MNTKANSFSSVANDGFDTKQMPGAWDSVDKDAPSDESTPYMGMSLWANKISTKHNILASWLMLAGYVVVPETFKDSGIFGNAGRVLQKIVQNVSLMQLAAVLCVAGTAGTYLLWWTWRQSCIWLIRQIFL